ncbi:hypothetical protein ACRAWD_03815 [Caulobacter segnis]
MITPISEAQEGREAEDDADDLVVRHGVGVGVRQLLPGPGAELAVGLLVQLGRDDVGAGRVLDLDHQRTDTR